MGIEKLDAIEATVARYSMDCDLVRSGMLAVAVEPHQDQWIEGESKADDSSIYFDQGAMQKEISSPTYLGGLWEKSNCATIHPAKLALELARVITDLGVVFHENTRVHKISDAGALAELQAEHGVIRAQNVALGTNAFPSLLKRNDLMTLPMYDFVLATQPLSGSALESVGWLNRQGVADMGNRFHYYRMTSDNRIVFGRGSSEYNSGRKMKPEYLHSPLA